ncbi:MAG TPA: hypothetical protein VNS79_11910 [Sphingobium sp.]|nr:hypothetical protein [Sphingobium sp.]
MNIGMEVSNTKDTQPDRFVKSMSASSRKAAGILHTDAPNLSYVNDWVVEKLSSHLRVKTAECVMDTFGISINTWNKMIKGVPIRRSVAERLLDRVAHYL